MNDTFQRCNSKSRALAAKPTVSIEQQTTASSLETQKMRQRKKEVENARKEVQQAKKAFEMMMEIRSQLERAYQKIEST